MTRGDAHQLTALDWLVIAAYGAAILSIGWYFSRRSKTSDDYLLGGRNMKPTAVGLSLFASLVSSVSYLAIPGEMIRYGPMILALLATYPVTVLVVGRWIVPFIMGLKVTSAYQILELRLGGGIRTLGSVIFLLMRLLWMAVIIQATSSKVLVPLSGLSPAYVPVMCLVLGMVTVIYTSMGGLRAVVIADVLQTCILFAGAIAALAVITATLGGIGQWWPHTWAPTWQRPSWLDPTARISFLSAFLAPLTWYICTSGSDQIAIQRYLATRDPRSARRVLTISMLADALVTVFLCLLGLALFAYFVARPQLLPTGVSVESNADQLFPRFIVMGLHHGLSGLIVAGLLGAAMSCLAGGVNSSCSVVVTDLVDRLSSGPRSPAQHMRVTRRVSWLIGGCVVALSIAVGFVQGNLFEISFRVINLLVAPLFVLFAMAMFIPWATAPGTWIAAACSIAVALLIDFWGGIFSGKPPSFQWIMPASLLAGITAGMLGSLLPFGQRRPMLPRQQEVPTEQGVPLGQERAYEAV